MTTPRGSRPRHLSSSPFKQAVEPELEVFEVGDRITHDLYGLGKVTHVDSHAVTVDCGSQSVRIRPPFAKLHHL
ncbi:hypothetical protein [Nocardioides hwasunensis]|uniref:ATP-binding protein n=1 Tax=Nocardioides hwasunensis TaxID=397258 RepID=A0ABR8MGX2_9ACTN|nr:hypothetical protein [Nocardioides hwasunensis]MBD3915324.1 hypothetical protein [Nocardioides hwasunensis]